MNKTPEEARAALDKLTWNATCDEDEQAVLMEAIDAYGAARELKGHVDACRTGQRVTDSEPGGITMSAGDCGDGGYCDKVEEIRKLGK